MAVHAGSRRRRLVVVSALGIAVLAGLGVWTAARGTARPQSPTPQTGDPVVMPGGVVFTPVGPANNPDGYAIGISQSGKAAADLKAGKKVVVPSPNGGTIEISPVEPAPTPPTKKQ